MSNLVNYHWDSSGSIDYVTPVVNRPWEWVENLRDPSAVESKGNEDTVMFKTKAIVKNSGSLSLDTFSARMTGDRILRNSKEDAWTEGNLRMFQDGLAGENIFKRDWWETRILLDAKVTPRPPVGRVGGELVQELGSITGSSGTFKERRTTPRGSPSSSVVSRSSTRGPTTSIRQSPVQGLVRKRSSSTTSDVIDVDSITTTRASSNKRKVAAIAVSDNEIEITEGPVLTQKKTKSKAPTKAKNKKK